MRRSQNPDFKCAIRIYKLKYCGVAWARYIPSTIPTRGTDDTAMNYYIGVVDAELTEAIKRILDDQQIDELKRAEIALPGTDGGLGLHTLRTAAPAAFMGTVIAAMPMAKATAPRLYDFMLGSLEREDEMHIDYA